ncbi:tetratricopeptide repeat protein [Desulfurella sp.]|uniref:tetratricopeptide repeat protein n=1 Tax=Desulfurella sp. TaxID=1962857 RepID=UPI003D153091
MNKKNLLISFFFILSGFLILANLANANTTLQDGLSAYNSKNYKQAYDIFYKLSQQGDSQAQYILGSMYLDGLGVKQDYKQAYEFFSESALRNNSFGEYGLGYLYKHGLGVKKDLSKTVYWWEKSAQLDNKYALYGLGFLYSLGQGVELNYKKSFDYWQKASYLGSSYAQYRLGLLYYEGEIEKNYINAYAWFDVSKRFSSPDEEIHALAVHHLNIVKYKLTTVETSQAKELADKLYNQIKNQQ